MFVVTWSALLAFAPMPAVMSRASATGKVPRVPPPGMETPLDLVVAASDGDIPAALELVVLTAASLLAVGAGWAAAQPDALDDLPPSPPRFTASETIGLEVDLGSDGEPAGPQAMYLKRLLPRSELLVVPLRVPLGLLIEESASHGGTVEVTGALPGFSALGHVEAGDLVRGVTAYRQVIAGAPMWQQVTSGTPMGTMSLKRCFFKVDAQTTYADVRDAIASHRTSDGGDGQVTLVLERAVNASTPLSPAPQLAPRLAPLQDVVLGDLGRAPSKGPADELGKASAGKRIRGLLGVGDEEEGG